LETPEFNKRKELLASEIHALLWDHDCVIIPGFGGLIGNYLPSQSHPVSHEFQPPSKQVAFNKNLNRDDGLLVRSIASRLSLDFTKSRLWVEETARAFHDRLMAGERHHLGYTGEFRMDIERNIVFQPDQQQQYLPQAYGLYAIRATPIQRVQRVVPEPQVRTLPRIETKRTAGKVLRQKLLLYSPLLLLALVPLLISRLPENSGAVSLKVNPFGTEAPRVLLSPKNIEIEPIVRKASLEDASGFSAASARIFIVAGCYSNGETAVGRVDYLREKGFDAAVLDLTPAGLYRVVYGGFDDILEAKSEMEKIIAGMNEDAWLLIR
jgi:hypothetical protein